MSVAQEIIRIAKAEKGYQEGRSGGHWNNREKYAGQVPGLSWVSDDEEPWCAVFTSWAALKANAATLYPRSASCAEGVAWFKRRNRFTEYPVIGGQVFYGSGGGTHTGIVYAYTRDTIFTIEGNTNTNGSAEGDGVYLKSRPRKSSYIYGYGIPDFPEGVVLADPAWQGRPGVTYFGQEASEADIPRGGSNPSTGYAPFPGTAWFKSAPRSPLVTAMGRRLVAEGCGRYSSGPGPQWTDSDRQSYAAWQRKRGFGGADADGWPGKATWDALKVPAV
ncbi:MULTISPECIES: peptidoglycan-binding protein [unclassified Streptomyces]|uniref:peptidoglycan-binding protein n=1 Tax=unclassified Streptomyces TaxID=2593676 RepID=UPI0036461BF9